MEEKVVIIDVTELNEAGKKAKFREFKENLKQKANNVRWWIYDNKEMIMVLGPGAIAGVVTIVVTIVTTIGRHVNLRKEENLKDMYCYDRSLGHYWQLRRKLTNKEWLEIDTRKKNGERLADILEELKVLK